MVTVHQAFLFDISANLINALVAKRTEVPTAILQNFPRAVENVTTVGEFI